MHSMPREWRGVVDTASLQVWCAGELPPAMIARNLPEHAGAIVGSLFPRSSDLSRPAQPLTTIESALARAIVTTEGRALVQDCWGSYVAFIHDRPDRVLTLVAPTGSLPCLVARLEGLTVWCSNVGDLAALNVMPIAPSLAYLTDRVISRFDARQPALESIERVQRGECQIQYVGRQTSEQRLYWHPLNFAQESEPIEDPSLAAQAMHAIIKHCTHTLADAHKPILLRLSGGLDSSIVAGCLSDVRQPDSITCHTYFDPRSCADVRPWARMAAEHAMLRHLEFAVDSTAIDLRALPQVAPSYDVHPLLPYVGRSRLERDLCATYGATAVFTGDGGDSGFCSDTISYALVEYLRRHGVRPFALKLARDVSLATHRSVWQVLTRSLRRWQLGSSLHDQQSSRIEVCQLVTRDILQVADHDSRYNHHWFAHCEAVPWPTIRRLGALCHPSHFYDLSVPPSAFAPHAVHPLYSQPVVETLLHIPLYVHFEDGRDRGLARRAFESELPVPIAQRLWKDRAPGFLQELIDRHRSWLRELFLDGVLVSSRLLDRSAVERALSASPSREPVNPAEIFRHLDIEIWARQWTAQRNEARSLGSLTTPNV